MNIRSTLILSAIMTGVVAAGCETTEETRPVNAPPMKQAPTSTMRERPVTPAPPPMSRQPQPAPMMKEPAPQPMVKDTPPVRSEPSRSTTTTGSDPLQTCLAAISKGASPGQRDIAEQTCQRDYGKNDARAVASGTQGDTVQSCMARIPKDATPGQRMVAEESCRRDDEVRKGF